MQFIRLQTTSFVCNETRVIIWLFHSLKTWDYLPVIQVVALLLQMFRI